MAIRCITAGQLQGTFVFPSGRKTFKWGIKEYKVVRVKRQRKRKDDFIWKLDRIFNECLGDVMPRDLIEAARKMADRRGLPFILDMKQNTPAKVSDLEALTIDMEE